MRIPVARPSLGEEEARAASEAVLSHWVTQGPRVAEFEKRFAAYAGAAHAAAVSSCTTALHLALLTAGVGEGDEVICPSMSYVATANSVMHAKARPVFAEVEPLTYNLSVSHTESLITSSTKAVLLVHQMGLPADIDAFRDLCARRGLKLIEDAACAAGSAYKGKKIGSHSELVCFSFHPRKVITTGDGGMVTTGREDYVKRLKLLRQHGMSVTDAERHGAEKLIFEEHIEIGFNYRMTDIQAAVGIVQLSKLDRLVEERRRIAQRYRKAFQALDCLRLPAEPEGYFSNYQSYPVYLKKNSPVGRDALMQTLWEKGIATKKGIMTAHREPAYRKIFGNLSLPVSEDASDRSLLLPLYVPMTEEETGRVIDAVLSSF